MGTEVPKAGIESCVAEWRKDRDLWKARATQAEAEAQWLRDAYDEATLLVGAMHAQAHGGAVVGPTIGAAEDVAALWERALQAEFDRDLLRTRLGGGAELLAQAMTTWQQRAERYRAALGRIVERVREYQMADRPADGLIHVGRIAHAELAPDPARGVTEPDVMVGSGDAPPPDRGGPDPGDHVGGDDEPSRTTTAADRPPAGA